MISEIRDYILKTYAVEPECPFDDLESLVFRHRENRKWFALVMFSLPREKLGAKDGGTVDILNLKCDPILQGSLLDGRRYFPGYHMNKEHWLTVVLDGSVSMEELKPLIDFSFDLTKTKKRKTLSP